MIRSIYRSIIPGILLFTASCARVGAPVGGEKDTKPPVLVKAVPSNGTVNFSAKEITFTFDEYVKLSNIQQQLLVSPALEETPEFKVRQRSVTISLKKPLQPNTTYNFNFGNAIVDVNEGNILKDFSYVISTGSYLDTLVISGKVSDAYTGAPKPEISVLLYTQHYDSVPFKEKPYYIARTNADGVFHAKNLKGGVYKLIAINDKNKNFLYEANEEIAFADSLVNVGPVPGEYHLRLFSPVPEKLVVSNKKVENDRRMLIGFNKPCPNCIIEEPPGQKTIYRSWFDSDSDSLFAWLKPGAYNKTYEYIIKDGTEITDTLSFLLKDPDPRRSNKTLELKPVFSTPVNSLVPLQFHSAEPIVDPGAMILIMGRDSVIKPYPLLPDSVDPNRYTLAFTPVFGGKYVAYIPDSGFAGIYGAYSTADTLAFETSREEYYGNLIFTIDNKLTSPAILLLTDIKTRETNMVKLPKGVSKQSFLKLLPSQYQVSVILDENSNGKWDTGDYISKKQPERVINYKEIVNVRSNWDLELEWGLE